jgi:hypothetical protein
VKPIVGDAFVRDPAQCRRMNFTAVSIRLCGADIVDEHNNDVGASFGRWLGAGRGL